MKSMRTSLAVATAITVCAAAVMTLSPAGAQAAPRWMSRQAGPNLLVRGSRLYQQSNYAGAAAVFRQAVQRKPNDTLAKVWLGLAEVASGDIKQGIFTLNYATDTIGAWSAQAAELRALTYWQQGSIDIAKSELGFCMNGRAASLCAKMKQGIDSGEQPPNVRAWPRIVGLTAAARARGRTWRP